MVEVAAAAVAALLQSPHLYKAEAVAYLLRYRGQPVLNYIAYRNYLNIGSALFTIIVEAHFVAIYYIRSNNFFFFS